MTQYFRHRENGRIISFHERLVGHPKLELVSHREAFPEEYAPDGVLEREAQVDISVPEVIINPPPYVAPELVAQVTRKLQSEFQATPMSKSKFATSKTNFPEAPKAGI